ncbi:MAG: hypothetical protein KGJ80_00785 [Chloroflexota bacterium]|nr:hypothetical protein [Chloroflexota bacterium]
MDRPRVYLICVNRLICEAVNALLHREGIELLGVETDPDVALKQVNALDPDIVLVEGFGADHQDMEHARGLHYVLDAAVDAKGEHEDAGSHLMSALAQLAYEKENLRIIRLSLPDEELVIYHQEQRRFMDTHDLVAAIRSSVEAE